MLLFSCHCNICKGMCHRCEVLRTAAGMMIKDSRHYSVSRIELEHVPCGVMNALDKLYFILFQIDDAILTIFFS